MITEWKDEYSVGDDILDAQHKQIFKLLMDSKVLLGKELSTSALQELIEKLKEYARGHFEAEESRMLKYNYEDYEKHKEEHQLFFKEIQKFEERVPSNDPFLLDDIFLYLSQWLVNHIQNEDMKYKGKI